MADEKPNDALEYISRQVEKCAEGKLREIQRAICSKLRALHNELIDPDEDRHLSDSIIFRRIHDVLNAPRPSKIDLTPLRERIYAEATYQVIALLPSA